MDKAVQDFIECKDIALVGASRSGKKFGNMAYKELKERDYNILLVHPEAQEINGVACYPNLDAVKDRVDGVYICVPPSQVEQVFRDAAEADLKNVWLQWQADTPELLQLGDELGLNLVSGKCVLMYLPPVRSYHAVHRFINKLFGKL